MLIFLIYFLFICVGGLVLWWLWFTTTRYYKLCSKIPGPTSYPIFGNIQLYCRKELTIDFFIKFTSEYAPITRLSAFNKYFVLLHDADHVNKVLKNTKTLSKGTFYEIIFRRFMGRSIISEPRDVWRKLRRIMNPTFSIHILKRFLEIFNEKCVILVDILKDKSDDGSAIDINEYLNTAALDMISQTSLGVNMHVQEDNLTDFLSTVVDGKKLIQTCVENPLYWIDFIFNLVEAGRRAKKIRSLGERFTGAIIEKKMKYYNENKEELNYINKNTAREKKLGFLDYVLGILHQTKEILTAEDLQAQVNILAGAGMDTTAFTLSVCLMLLGIYKDVQDKVMEELRDIFGDDTNRSAEYEDLQKMSYTEKVIKETLRLFPVTFITVRRADEDIEIGGYIVPAGTEFILSPLMLHRNPKYFPDPLKFDPERFSPENCNTQHPHCYIPFLSGPRMCIGYQYAMLQMKTVLSHILRKFEISPCGTREQMEEFEMSFILSLKHGYNVRLKVRT